MNLYLLSQTDNRGYDTYDSAVVAAKSEEEARKIHPQGDEVRAREGVDAWETYLYDEKTDLCLWSTGGSGQWAARPSLVSVRLLGTAHDTVKPGVILASFNAA